MRSAAKNLALWSAIALLLFLAPRISLASAILTADIDRDTIRVGEPILLTLQLDAAMGEDVRLPEFPGEEGVPFSLLEIYPPEEVTEGGVRSRTLRLKITAWETGDFEIPALEPIGGGVGSKPIPVAVLSVGLDETGDIRDVKDPLAPERNWFATLLPWGALALVAALITWLIIRRRGRKALPDPVLARVDLRPAHLIAIEEINHLERDWAEAAEEENGDRRIYFFRISQVVREYIHNRFALPAPERTTREIMREIKGERIATESTGLLRELLAECDIVKYRGNRAESELFESLVERSLRFVEGTRESRGESGGEEERS